MEPYIIGVDAGGTKTHAALYDCFGEKHADAKSGYGNLLVDPEAATVHIGDAIAACLQSLPGRAQGAGIRIYVGAAGIHAGDNRTELLAGLRRRFPEAVVRVEDDALLALYSVNEGNDGMLVIAGTGSIAYGKRGGQVHRAGGWGNILGDEGSGYDISRKALAQITAEFDSGGGYGPLSRRLLEAMDTDVWGVVKFAHTAKKGEIAALLPLVEQMALLGDSAASRLLEEAGDALAKLPAALYRRMGFSEQTALALKGGVLEKIPIVREAFVRSLAPGQFAILEENRLSERGAFYLFREEQGAE